MNSWCNYCSNKKLYENEDCKDCFDKSFSSNKKVKFWSNKNKLKHRQVFKSTADKYWFDCNKCNHKFESSLSAITQNTWCIYCANQKLCENMNYVLKIHLHHILNQNFGLIKIN